jgi:hypothetical protein
LEFEVPKRVANPGSALGEAISALIELALNRSLKPVAEANNCLYITAGPRNLKTGRNTKLLLKDSNGVEYQIDAVIANNSVQPLVLIESKYIRYKKHNRDKGSWVCTAHSSLRKRFSSVRSSTAVLAGSWSKTSKAMLRSADITLFEIPFDTICEMLTNYGIDFSWDEKDREKAYQAWNNFASLSDGQKLEIGDRLISVIETDLDDTISKILDNTTPRSIQGVEIQVTTNLGEVKIFSFASIEEALKFLQELDQDELLNAEDSPSLFENQDIQSE